MTLHTMTLDRYLEELTDKNWHTLRQLIEWNLGLAKSNQEEKVSCSAYLAARTIITN